MNMTPQQFDDLFNKFDVDKDGIISYKDFQTTIGIEINPPEELYFRQDVKRVPKPIICQYYGCPSAPAGTKDFCSMHLKTFKERGTKFIQKLFLKH